MKSELETLVEEIKNSTKQTAINKVDEYRVMKCMLNDKDFSVSVYDKNGYCGESCPHNEAVNFVKNVICETTGLDSKSSKHLAESYEFTKRDATFMLDTMRSFIKVYMDTGRKINIMQTEHTEACLYTKPIEAGVKLVPDKDNSGSTKEIKTSPYVKLVSANKCPNYSKK